MPFYDGDWFDLVATGPAAKTAFAKHFYSDEARDSRNARRDAVKTRLSSIVEALEVDLSKVTAVTVPRRETEINT